MKYWNQIDSRAREFILVTLIFAAVWYLCNPVLSGATAIIFQIGWTPAALYAIRVAEKRSTARALNGVRSNWS